MTFGRPDLLWLLALAVPLIALYLIRKRRQKVRISSLVLWDRVLAAAPRRFGAGILTSLLSLLLMLLALGGGALSAADPILGEAAPAPRHLLLALGASARMEGDRFEQAVLLARREIALKAPYDPVTLVLVSDRPRLPAVRETSRVALSRALDQARSSLVPANWPLAGPMIEDVLAEEGRAVAIGVSPVVPPGTSVLPVSGDNAGLTGFSVEIGDQTVRVFVRVAGTTPDAEVVLDLDGVELMRAPAREEVLLTVPRGEGGLLKATLTPSFGPTFDDQAEAVIPAPVSLTVGVSSEAATDPFLRAALAVSGAVAGAGPEFDVRVVAGRAAPERLTPGAWILITDPPAALGLKALPRVDVSPIWSSSSSHPVMRGVDAAEVQVLGAIPAELPEGAEALLTVPGGAVAAAGEVEGARYVWIGLATGNSTLPVTGAFPLMIRNALSWFASLRTVALPAAVPVGEPVQPAVQLPRGTSAVVITGPGPGEREVVTVTDGSFSFTPAHPVEGEVRVAVGREEHRTRLNAIYPEESTAAPLLDVSPVLGADRSGLADTEQRLWPFLALAAVLFLLLEWGLAALGR
jgi:Aerotolerance regulator N-terminal